MEFQDLIYQYFVLILYVQCHQADYQPANGMSQHRLGLGDMEKLGEYSMRIGQAREHLRDWTNQEGEHRPVRKTTQRALRTFSLNNAMVMNRCFHTKVLNQQ